MRFKRLNTFRRQKIPVINPVEPGQEYEAHLVVFCSKEELNAIPEKIKGLFDAK